MSRGALPSALDFVVLLWVVHLVRLGLSFLGVLSAGASVRMFGIRPGGGVASLWTVFSAPLIHGDWGHLVANSISLLLLGGLVGLQGGRRLWQVSIISALVSGWGTWLVAPPTTVHVGASGVVFGYLGALLAAGWFQRRPLPILLSVATVLLFGQMVTGLFPGEPGVSWQGHLFGFLGGLLAARLTTGSAAPARDGGKN